MHAVMKEGRCFAFIQLLFATACYVAQCIAMYLLTVRSSHEDLELIVHLQGPGLMVGLFVVVVDNTGLMMEKILGASSIHM